VPRQVEVLVWQRSIEDNGLDEVAISTVPVRKEGREEDTGGRKAFKDKHSPTISSMIIVSSRFLHQLLIFLDNPGIP
jgi:hypothetical protein